MAAADEEWSKSERLFHLPKASLTMLIAWPLKTSPAVASRRHRFAAIVGAFVFIFGVVFICSDAASIGFKMSPQA